MVNLSEIASEEGSRKPLMTREQSMGSVARNSMPVEPFSDARQRFRFGRKPVRALLMNDTILLLIVGITTMRPAPDVSFVTGAGEAPHRLRWVRGVRIE